LCGAHVRASLPSSPAIVKFFLNYFYGLCTFAARKLCASTNPLV
jgi:hypothetical protein